jgi:hypothetical protein
MVSANIVLAELSQDSNFYVSPMVNILDLRNGQGKGLINVTNKGRNPLRLRIYAENFTYERSQGYISIDNHPQSAINYLQFAPRELVVPPGITRNVRVAMTLPSSLPNGEYRASIFIEDLKEQDITADSQQISLKTRVASLFYFNKGEAKSEVSMDTATWRPTSKDLMIVIKNKGKKTSFPNIYWRLEKDGKVATKNQILGIILQSQNEREFPIAMESAKLTSGNYNFIGEIKGSDPKPIPFNIKVAIP